MQYIGNYTIDYSGSSYDDKGNKYQLVIITKFSDKDIRSKFFYFKQEKGKIIRYPMFRTEKDVDNIFIYPSATRFISNTEQQFVVEERFTSSNNLDAHYNKHVKKGKEFKDITKEQYELLAEELQKQKIDNKTIFGYMSETREKRTAYCKYDKSTGVFVVYTYSKDGKPLTITCYTKTWREYNGDKAIEYYNEIPEGK